MTPYLPKYATIEQACDWLEHETGESWILARLLECHLKPWIWIDYKPGWPDIFGSRLEGYLAPMVFAGDTQRMEADGTDALVTMTRTHDGKLLKIEPGWRVPLAEIRFKRENIQRVLEKLSLPAVEPEQPAPSAPQDAQLGPTEETKDWKSRAREIADEIDAIDAKVDAYDSVTSLADRVAEQMRARNICGPRGPLTGGTVLREALQGRRWQRKR